MRFMLLDYVNESGWPTLSRAEQEHWLEVYKGFMRAMQDAGVLRSSGGLYPSASARKVEAKNQKPVVVDGPYAETKEQLGGFHIIEVRDAQEAISWAQRSPTALHGTVEVRQLRDGTLLTEDSSSLLNPQ
ncbi:MAG: YciI family protein [Acidobacteria bacterium]|nr:YciI family protein [Acidobacteriota bacterium]